MGATGFDGIETLVNGMQRTPGPLKSPGNIISADYGYMAAA